MNDREQFLSDIIVCAVEGGIGYWSSTTYYQVRDDDTDEVRSIVGGPMAYEVTAALVIDTESGDYEAHLILPSTIERGITRLIYGDVSYPSAARDLLVAASADNDAGMIDADDADAIVQAALLGEIVYG